jgi:hypothetical protein
LFVCLIFYLLSILCSWFVGPCGDEPKWYNILRFRTTTFHGVLASPAQSRLQNMGIKLEKDTQNVSMTLAWVILS